MIVEQIWTGNAYRNFNYLIACAETGEALAIDPLDHEKCLALAKARGWTITQVLNTHEHGDHIGGNQQVVSATGARVLAHNNAREKIRGMDEGLDAGDVVRVGKSVELLTLDTPGHTMSHVCLLSKTDIPALFCGDTLFNAGAGNCHNGHPNELYETFVSQLNALAEDTLIYPGHDYITNNLEFTLDREADNESAAKLLDGLHTEHDPDHAMITTIALEKDINTFFRLTSPSVIARLRESFPDLPDEPSPREVFVKLRELRNSW
ncbi:MAG: hydroxyacylglutathione hydrolase [Pseudomonadales bacterium]|nr:hydroxyacylglutathione hydrolase [Pseudomonadales bacterium]MDP6470509.1 hydroxyacylglutathione hydrolase [Pseudomonadales bacterium]MDP6827811.1 hydroxyacylglutathione hydrolase [Pseudomonadales bacterium]MDP6972983.1 hydroxyacylglutathione hydrolase [Pseudomonadales bacterium]